MISEDSSGLSATQEPEVPSALEPSGLDLAEPDLEGGGTDTDGSQSYPAEPEHRRDPEARAQIAQCARLLGSPGILIKEFNATLWNAGYAGDTRPAALIYLALVSRLLDRPVSIAVKASSSSGKSFAIEEVLKFFPDDATHRLSASSEKALIYSDADLRHRTLYIAEAEGLGGDMMQSLIRGLLSEGRIDYEYTDFGDGSKPTTRRLQKEGPTGLLVSTTRSGLHHELETRMLSVGIDDSPEQTRLVLKAIASRGKGSEGRSAVVDYSEWHALQRFLEMGPRQVDIPFADVLAEMVPTESVRMRRDFSTVLSLVGAHALLHRDSRPVRFGRVVATITDYDIVAEILEPVLSVTVGSSVAPTVRETHEAVAALSKANRGDPVRAGALAERLEIDVSNARRRAHDAIAANALINVAPRRHPLELLPEPLPEEDRPAIPSGEDLWRELTARGMASSAIADHDESLRIGNVNTFTRNQDEVGADVSVLPWYRDQVPYLRDLSE